jgi:hypothetical protein
MILTWSCFMIFLICCWIWLANILLRGFCIYVRDWPVILYYCYFFVWFGDECNTGLHRMRLAVFLPFLFCGKVWVLVLALLKVLVEFSGETIKCWDFHFWENINTSISLLVIDMFIWVISYWLNFEWWNVSRNLSISSRFSSLLEHRFSK